jgi:type III restriction enzyme
MESPEVLAKKEVAVAWCKNASDHARSYNGKPWKYLLIPHDIIADNMSLDILSKQFSAN